MITYRAKYKQFDFFKLKENFQTNKGLLYLHGRIYFAE